LHDEITEEKGQQKKTLGKITPWFDHISQEISNMLANICKLIIQFGVGALDFHDHSSNIINLQGGSTPLIMIFC